MAAADWPLHRTFSGEIWSTLYLYDPEKATCALAHPRVSTVIASENVYLLTAKHSRQRTND